MENLGNLHEVSAPWLELGISGAALFIVLILVILMFRQQSNSIDKLCSKIDELVSSYSTISTNIHENLFLRDKQQDETLRKLDDIEDTLADMHTKIVRIDAKMFNFKEKGDDPKV